MIDRSLFVPTAAEEKFSPDDWAWQFLRLNDEYRSAFRRSQADVQDGEAMESLRSCLLDPSRASIVPSSPEAPAHHFGVGAWLAPEHESLPELKANGSWFFPLRRVIQEDPLLEEVGRIWPCKLGNWRHIGRAYPRLVADETPFGYGAIRRAYSVDTPHRERMVWAAIDCSVPVDGQILTFNTLAKLHRAYWQQEGLRTSDKATVVVEPVEYEDVFSHVNFRRTLNSGISHGSCSRQWRTVGIDALGPISTQTEDCLRRLRGVHHELREQESFEGGWPRRFPHNINGAAGASGEAPKNSRYLKALIVIAKALSPESLRPNDLAQVDEIAAALNILPSGLSFPDWLERFYEGMEKRHLPRAYHLMKRRYRWLVHGQITLRDARSF